MKKPNRIGDDPKTNTARLQPKARPQNRASKAASPGPDTSPAVPGGPAAPDAWGAIIALEHEISATLGFLALLGQRVYLDEDVEMSLTGEEKAGLFLIRHERAKKLNAAFDATCEAVRAAGRAA